MSGRVARLASEGVKGKRLLCPGSGLLCSRQPLLGFILQETKKRHEDGRIMRHSRQECEKNGPRKYIAYDL